MSFEDIQTASVIRYQRGSILVAPLVYRPVFIDVVGFVRRKRIDAIERFEQVALASFVLTDERRCLVDLDPAGVDDAPVIRHLEYVSCIRKSPSLP